MTLVKVPTCPECHNEMYFPKDQDCKKNFYELWCEPCNARWTIEQLEIDLPKESTENKDTENLRNTMKKMNEDFFANQIARIEYLEIALDILTCTIIRNLGDSFTLEEIQELKTAMAWLSKHQENAIGSPRTNYRSTKRVLGSEKKEKRSN